MLALRQYSGNWKDLKMKKLLVAALFGLGVSAFPVNSQAAVQSPNPPMVLAQDVDVRVGPGGVRILGGEDRDRDLDRRRFREREFERRRFRDRDADRDYRVVRRQGCRIIVIRRETMNGSVTRRVRRCG